MDDCEGEKMIVLASAISFQLAKSNKPQDLLRLISFLNVLASQLALLIQTNSDEISYTNTDIV